MHLRAGDERQRRQIAFQQPDILNNQAVNSGIVKFGDETQRGGKFVVIQQRVQRDIDARPVAAREGGQPGNVRDAVSGLLARPESRRADIHGIRAAGDGGYAEFGGFRRG